MEKLRYALIGCGRISPNHIAAYQNQSEFLELSALCDLDKKSAEGLKEKFNLKDIPIYTDYHTLLKEQKPDLAAIATDSGSHAKIALDCLESSCHVIIEKPIALSLGDADLILEKAAKKKCLVCACHQNRFNRSILKIREALLNGRFGRLYHGAAQVRWNRSKEYYDQALWRGTWAKDGGALMNQCIHNIDLLRWMMGEEITEVFAYTDRLSHDYIEAEDLGLALVRFTNGSYGMIEGTTNVFPKNMEETLSLFGEKGSVKVGGKSVNRIEEWRFADETLSEEEVKERYSETPPNIYGFGHTPLYLDMIQAIIENKPPLCDGLAGRRALELVLGIYQSAARHEAISFPLTHVETTDFTGRFPNKR